MRREEILACARSYVGVPWRHQARSRQAVDCAGLVVMVCRDFGLDVQDRTDYTRNARAQEFIQMFRQLPEVKHADAKPGDVIILRDNIFPCHCGFLSEMEISREKFPAILHAYASRRKVVEEPFSRDLMDRWLMTFSLPGVED